MAIGPDNGYWLPRFQSHLFRPLNLILRIGNQCTNSPSKIPHRYCVMDWFKVTAAWAEKDLLSQHTRWKFRFEKLNTNCDGWWAATPSEESNPPPEMVKASCLSCHRESPQVYEQGWACLKPDCKRFWIVSHAYNLPLGSI